MRFQKPEFTARGCKEIPYCVPHTHILILLYLYTTFMAIANSFTLLFEAKRTSEITVLTQIISINKVNGEINYNTYLLIHVPRSKRNVAFKNFFYFRSLYEVFTNEVFKHREYKR